MGDAEDVDAPRVPAGWELAALERLPIPAMAVGPGRRIVFWNHECARVTGYSSAEALGDAEFLRRLYPRPPGEEPMEPGHKGGLHSIGCHAAGQHISLQYAHGLFETEKTPVGGG